MKPSVASVSIALTALLLAGCPPTPGRLKTVTLSPSRFDWGYQANFSSSWECSVPLSGGLSTHGLGPIPPPTGQLIVGWVDTFLPGAQPAPCNEESQVVERGNIAFDLTKFDTIADATLNFGPYQSQPSATPAQSFATTLGMSTGTRDDGNGPYYWDYDNDVSLGPCAPLTGCSVDVSHQANLWTTQQHFNYGFIFAGPKYSPDSPVPQDNNSQLTWYGGFSLVVLYNPALNPRAPQ